MRGSLSGHLLSMLTLLISVGCSSSGAGVEIALLKPAAPDPFDGVRTLRVTITGEGMQAQSAEAILGQDSAVEVPPISLGISRQVRVEGLDASGQLVSAGSSALFDLTSDGPKRVEVPFRQVERFSLMSTPLPTARYDHAAQLLADGRVAVVGGRDAAGNASAVVEIYDPVADTFTSAPALTTARAKPHLALAQDQLVVVGGETGSGAPVGTVEIYDPTSGTVDTFSLNRPRTRAACTAVTAASFFLVGGVESGGAMASRTEIIDASTRRASEGPEEGPLRADLVALTLASGTVIVAGGVDASGDISSSTFEYVIGGDDWSSRQNLSAGRARAVGVLLSDQAWLIGGEGPSPERLVIVGAADFGPSMALPRTEHAAVALDADRALVAGGAGQALASVELIEATGVKATGELNAPRRKHTLTALGDGTAVVIGGVGGDGAPVAEVERYYAR